MFFNRNLTVSTKVAVYTAICRSILLYGCESWIPYLRHIKALEAYPLPPKYPRQSAFVGGTGRHIQKYVRLPKLNSLSSYYYKDNFGGWVTSYLCHPTVFHVVYSMANCNSDEDQLADQSCVTQTTSSPYSGNATSQNLS